jgi:hypothetical protein
LTLPSQNIVKLEEEIQKKLSDYFSAYKKEEKEKIKREYRILIEKLKQSFENEGFPSIVTEKIIKYDPFDTNIASDWFDPFWMFGIKEGFDVVIANPPYIRIYRGNIKKELLSYLKKHYESAFKKFDIYVIFMERGISLLREGGFITYIVPDKWLTQPYGEKIRKYILGHCKIISLADLTQIKVFEDANVDNFIFLFQKKSKKENILENKIKVIRAGNQFIREKFIIYEIEQSSLTEKSFNGINIYNNEELQLLEKIKNKSLLLKEIFYVNWGCRPSPREKFVFETNLNNKCQPLIVGSNIEKYYISPNHLWVLYDKSMYNPMFRELFENTTIVFKDIIGKGSITAALNTMNYYSDFTVITAIKYDKVTGVKGIKIPSFYYLYSFYDEKFVLGIVNSKLESFYFNKTLRNGLHTLPNGVKNLLIPKISAEKQKDIISIVDQILEITRQPDYDPDSSTEATRKVKSLEQEIDQLVYQLYGLTDEEIKIIGGVGK